MKKLLFAILAIVAVSTTSCKKNVNTETSTVDSTLVDTTKVDTLSVDTTKVDTKTVK